MWFIFPQLARPRPQPHRPTLWHRLARRGARLSRSSAARTASARMRRSLLPWASTRTAEQILGPIDAMKLRSSLTLVRSRSSPAALFAPALDGFFGGQRDERTLALLNGARKQARGQLNKEETRHAQASVRVSPPSASPPARPPPRSRSATRRPTSPPPARSAARSSSSTWPSSCKKGPVVLYFFPKAFTSGCTAEAHAFSDVDRRLQEGRRAGDRHVGRRFEDAARISRSRNAAAPSRSRPQRPRPRRPMTSPGPRIRGSQPAPPT